MRYSRIISHSLLLRRTTTSQNPRFLHKNVYFNHISVNPNYTFSRVQSGNYMNFSRQYTASAEELKTIPSSDRVSSIVDEISGLTLLEVADLTEILRKKLDVNEMPVMAMMMPGMGFGMKGSAKGGGAVKGEEKKVEKTAFDLKLEGGFDASVKIKIIKEVRACTDLGLKEAKDLVEKAPTLLKKGVTKEEADKIIEKMKVVGAKVIME